MSVTPIPIFNDNYVWKISTEQHNQVVLVDPGCAKSVIDSLAPHEQVCAILVTHHHHDHIGGLTALQAAFPDVHIYGPKSKKIDAITHQVAGGDNIFIEALDLNFTVIDVPGHTLDHVCYFSEPHLFCGDTLFSAGCGRMFEGTPAQFYTSLSKILALPDTTLVYCAHEYTLANLAFAQHVDPNNTQLNDYVGQVKKRRAERLPSLPALLATEKQINPFLRTNLTSMQQQLSLLTQQTINDPINAFAALRKMKDDF